MARLCPNVFPYERMDKRYAMRSRRVLFIHAVKKDYFGYRTRFDLVGRISLAVLARVLGQTSTATDEIAKPSTPPASHAPYDVETGSPS